ncbi:5'-3' exoribonuclease 1 isoform X1 [Diaphorina citri]|uniref:5'-3' exoribonuclease 1 n=2 Tax=Diaphorina citri TaxID=121845 RepID=A0A3Q0J3Q3_DIACI|nr:5'-3' exoribonuclease 1 isoform X1 [Diaphorina citri]
MGVPKFFRYISERYPCLSEVVREYQIPEFDNLYLDMNGIIHNCSHPNDNDPHFRITEKQIFQDIFHYIEILFRMIQPKKLFFMAIDGVAPRAKMNQQRGRRFRSAKEAEVLEQKAKEKGERLPTEKRFDSNCITPGTPFMCRLHQQLRYFVKLKITTDKLWKDVCVILSGHETPGEGEHKIMDYIRYMKSKPDYNPNMRHCLYGLDADLIMLGLCTHEPYFSLLREEVKFNTKSNKGGSQIVTPEETKFFLLHLSLMRDYLELEFGKLKEPGVLSFPFSIENIIDDWVLMGFLIGNDFIPNLPDLHIINGALPLLYKVYQEVLPTLDGYINEGGYLNLKRFEKFLTKLASFDFEQFREKYADIQYLEGKMGKKFSDVFHKEKSKEMDPDLAALIKATDDDYDDGTEEVLNYANYEEYYYSDEDEEWRTNFFSEFGQHKTDYYHYKLDYAKVTNEVLRDQAECYIRAIQWNLHYYYNGCVSWSWYYPHHYAPYISDIKDFSHLNLKYEMGEPFLPFQQLLAVLPAASKELLPEPYQNLMTLENSPILEYYPEEFATDLNGKKQDWEAVVLIPFIDEVKLIKAMDAVEHLLTDEERSRNRHGPMLVYTYSNVNLGTALAPDYFPAINENHAVEKPLYRDDIYVHPNKLRKGLCQDVNLKLYVTHFPTLKHVQFTHKIENAKVKVFQQPSRNESIIIVQDKVQVPSLKQVADQILGKTIFINYPHLIEIRVQAVATKDSRISFDKNSGPVFERAAKDMQDAFQLSKKSITDGYYTKLGVDIGNTEVLVYGQPVESRKYFFGPRGKVTQQRTFIRSTVTYAYQSAVLNLQQARESLEYKTIDEIFYPGCQCFALSNPHYGSGGCVISTVKEENSFIKLSFKVQQEPDLSDLVHLQDDTVYNYLPSYTVASKLSISPLLLSRFTGSIFIIDSTEEGAKRHNIGLNIKFSRKNEEVVGFTRRDETTKKWFYTEQVVTLIKNYMKQFPEVFGFLKDHSSDDIYLRDDVFPHQGEQRVAQIVSWLKEQPHAKAEVRPCGAAVVDAKVVSLIEHAVDTCEKVEKQITLFVKPNKLYIPKPTLDKLCPDPDTKFKLFDRVVNIRDCYTVPLGYRGTIIGIVQGETSYDAMYDVVFDKPFPHGVKIRCSESRGYRMPAQAMINLSYGERLCGNSNPHVKNINVMQSRGERNTNYAQVTRQPQRTTFYKENAPLVNSNLQVTSPYHVKVSRCNSQQSSVSQSPSSTMISQQSSPFNVKPTEKTEPPPPHKLNQVNTSSAPKEKPRTSEQNQIKSNGNEQKVIINKEERCIFSNATYSIPTTQNSELFSTGGMSFFGYPNLLDIPENKNKLLTGEITANKMETKPEKATCPQDKEVEEITNGTQTITMNDLYQSANKRSENGFNIPSISDLIKQNNITAKTDYPTTSTFPEVKYTNSPSDNGGRTATPDTSFTTKLTNLFNRSSSNDTEAENTFKRAISAMVQQSPHLLEKNKELNTPSGGELSFEEKHSMAAKSKNETTPTIKTEMRKIISSSDYQGLEEEEEEEVMIIEIKEDLQQQQTVEPEQNKQAVSTDPFKEFLCKLKVNSQAHNAIQVDTKSIPTIDQLENPSDININTITADTINDFFVEASRRQALSQKINVNTEVDTNSKHIVPNTHIRKPSNESSGVNASDMLKKMLNIESTSPSQADPAMSTRTLVHVNQEPVEQIQKPMSAFTVVKPTTTAGDQDKTKVMPKNALLSSLKNKPQALNPCVPSFIPPQVQKQHIDKIKPLVSQFPPHPDQLAQPGDDVTSLIRPQPGPVRGHTNSSDLSRSTNAQPRGIPILGSQAAMYNPSVPYQQQQQYQYYYNQQQPMYYPQQVAYPPPVQVYPNSLPGRTSQSTQSTGQIIHSQTYYSHQNQVQTQQAPQQSLWHSQPGAYQNRTSTSQFQPYQQARHPQYSKPPHPILNASSQPVPPDTTEDLEERADSYLAKLLRLTRAHNLGAPDYTFSMDASKLYVATVRICHPHSDIVVRGKPCAKKADSVEICARRAFNELTQIYPTAPNTKSASDVTRAETKTAVAAQPAPQNTEVDQTDKNTAAAAEKKEKKAPRIAAKFKTPLNLKN